MSKKNSSFYVTKCLDHIKHLKDIYPDHDNLTHVKSAYKSFFASQIYYLVAWVSFAIIASVFFFYSVYVFSMVIDFVISNELYVKANCLKDEFKDEISRLKKIISLPLVSFAISVILAIILYVKKFHLNIFTELRRRFLALQNRADIDSLTIEQIDRYLNSGVSKWDIVINADHIENIDEKDKDYIEDKLMFQKLIGLCISLKDIEGGKEQINRIGAYAYRCNIIKTPTGNGYKGKMFDLWQRLNGGLGAGGSKMLIHTPNHVRAIQSKKKIKSKLNDLIELFKTIDFKDGIEKVESDYQELDEKSRFNLP